jgi:signal transduction histidine kinase
MSLLRQHRWYVAAATITLAFAVVSLTVPQGRALTAISDLAYLFLILALCGAMLVNAWSARGTNRRVWALMGSGCILWALHQSSYVYYEVLRQTTPPDPWFMDVVLFFHPIPMIAIVGLRAHSTEREQKFRVGTLDFLLLLVWWMFLYAFLVFPSQYVSLDVAKYDRNYNALYMVECSILVLALGIAAGSASAAWRVVYLNLMAASALYALDSGAINLALTNGRYYTGSLYDVPLMGAVNWMAAAALTARQTKLTNENPPRKWQWGSRVAPRLAMLAILSLPALGLWTAAYDKSPPAARTFRLFAVLDAMLVLGVFLFLRQYVQDQVLMRLLEDSRKAYENQHRLQSHLVQKEKLASLGNLVADAAHEIDHPLCAIMAHSEQLWANGRLSDEQSSMVRKVVHQARRTRDLVASLLSFARQSHGERADVDLATLLQRGAQMLEAKHLAGRISVAVTIEKDLPRVTGNANQLFQAFYEIMENAMDAMAEVGGGSLQVSAFQHSGDAVLQFSDTGPGMTAPERVFDPFYTTKPVGKGTGLGLSAAYGVVQEHGGQITCQNKSEGGALFILRLPGAQPALTQPAAEAAKA